MRLLAFILFATSALPVLGVTRIVTSSAEFAALPTLQPGDTVIIRGGVYPNVVKRITGNGTSEQRITIVADPLGKAFFTGATYIEIGGSFITVAGLSFDGDAGQVFNSNASGLLKLIANSSDCIVTNCMFRRVGTGQLNLNPRNNCLTVQGYRHTVEFCSFEDAQDHGSLIMVDAPEGIATAPTPRAHRIRYNYFGPRPAVSAANGFEAIQMGVGGTAESYTYNMSAIVDHNLFFRYFQHETFGWEEEIISNKTANNTYRYNTVIGSSGQFTGRGGDNCTYESNFFLGEGRKLSSGIRVFGRNHVIRNNHFQDLNNDNRNRFAALNLMKGATDTGGLDIAADNAKVFHNTFVNCTSPLFFGDTIGGTSPTVEPVGAAVINNVVQSVAGAGVVFRAQTPLNLITFAGNHVYHAGGNYGVTGITGVVYGPTPDLRPDPSLGYYVPQAGSPIVDRAVATDPSTTLDLRGRTRPTARTDIGAIELEASGTGFGPKVRSEVGPSFNAGPSDTYTPPSSQLINLSILTNLAPDETLTLGTVLGGALTVGAKPLLVRAVGPSLAPLGVANTLSDPRLELLSGQTVVAANNDWAGMPALADAFSAVGAFAFVSGGSRDAAILGSALAPGPYTVRITGSTGGTGAVLAELYDSTSGTFTQTTPRLVNVSVLKQLNGGEILTAGFVVRGNTDKTVLIRAVGPTLGAPPFNVGGAHADPRLELFRNGAVVSSNNDWTGAAALSSAATAVGAFAFTGTTSRDAAILAALAPGNYTAQVSGAAGTSGVVLVEVYEVP